MTTQHPLSLACVFFTDKESGLGCHGTNPDSGTNQCWCPTIYGKISFDAYLCVVDLRQITEDELERREADAAAMGQCLVKRTKLDTDKQWRRKLEQARLEAEANCAANRGRAPWGCHWFEKWQQNVELAVQRGQTLHVFYFENMKGEGKMKWEDLCNQDVQ